MASARTGAGSLEEVHLLELAPVRAAEWRENDDGRAVVERPAPGMKGLRGLLEHVAFLMSTKFIRLDAVGTFTWRRLDGTSTVRQISEAVRGEFGEEAEPAEERVGQFVRMLRAHDLVAYPGWDEVTSPATSPRPAD